MTKWSIEIRCEVRYAFSSNETRASYFDDCGRRKGLKEKWEQGFSADENKCFVTGISVCKDIHLTRSLFGEFSFWSKRSVKHLFWLYSKSYFSISISIFDQKIIERRKRLKWYSQIVSCFSMIGAESSSSETEEICLPRVCENQKIYYPTSVWTLSHPKKSSICLAIGT